MNLHPNLSRSGNAIVAVVIVLATVGSVIALSADNAIASIRRTQDSVGRIDVESAVQAVLARRERLIADAVSGGAEGLVRRFDPNWDPVSVPTSDFIGRDNYGVDFIGEIPVKWAIEPVRTRRGSGANEIPDAATPDLNWIQNPKVDATAAPLTNELPNDIFYLFRVRAEARHETRDNVIRRAQGVRYISADKEPLFRYLLFYAKEGPLGDMELTHGPQLDLQGSIHSNGTIFLGGVPVVNQWYGLNPGPVDAGPTRIGPTITGEEVRVGGVDGIVRMHKSLNVALAAGLGSLITGAAPALGTWYDTGPGIFIGEGALGHYPAPTGSTIAEATRNGWFTNPNRILAPGLATIDNVVDYRSINGRPIVGRDFGSPVSLQANDSRDVWRLSALPVGLTWADTAMLPASPGFNRMARTWDNGGRVIRLPSIMSERCFEPQAIRVVEFDGNPGRDDHRWARPLFADATGDTPVLPAVPEPIETPGTYLGYALGNPAFAMQRDRSDGAFTGWRIVNRNAPAVAVNSPQSMGLIIRERPVPEHRHWIPAGATQPGDIEYKPFAYGKHGTPSLWPFWSIDVAARRGWNNGSGFDTAVSAAIYNQGTSFGDNNTIVPVTWSTTTPLSHAAETYSAGTLSATVATGVPSGVPSVPAQYFRDQWRLWHLQRPEPDPTTIGTLLAQPFRNRTVNTDIMEAYLPASPSSGEFQVGPFAGISAEAAGFTLHDRNADPETGSAVFISSGVIQTSAGSALSNALGLGANQNHYSAVITGFMRVTTAGTWRPYARHDDGLRVWLADRLAMERWEYTAGYTAPSNVAIPLDAGTWYPIVIEFHEGSGGDWLDLRWQRLSASGTWVQDDAVAYCRPLDTRRGPITKHSWDRLTARIRTADIGDGKVGLMIRPLQRLAGISAADTAPLPAAMDARDPYAAILYNPSRGVFGQFRGMPATIDARMIPTRFVGAATAPSGSSDAGQLNDEPDVTNRTAIVTPQFIYSILDPVTMSSVGALQGAGPVRNYPSAIPAFSAPEGTFDRVIKGPMTVRVNRRLQYTLTQSMRARWWFIGSGFDIGGAFASTDLSRNRVFTIYSSPLTATPMTIPDTVRGVLTPGLAEFRLRMGAHNYSPVRLEWEIATPNTLQATWSMTTPVQTVYVTLAQSAGASYPSTVNLGGLTWNLSVTDLNTPWNQANSTSTARNVQFDFTHSGTHGGQSVVWYGHDNNFRPRLNGSTLSVANATLRVDGNSGTAGHPFENHILGVLPGTGNGATEFVGYANSLLQVDTTVTPPTVVPPNVTAYTWAAVPSPSLPRTFDIFRGGWDKFDLNPMVSNYGQWHASPRSFTVPWDIEWLDSVISSWASGLPQTGSFMATYWDGLGNWGAHTAANYPRRAGIDSQVITDVSTAETVGIGDQPAGWSGPPSHVWVQLRRLGDDIHPYYFVGDAEPAETDWRPLLTQVGGTQVVWPMGPWRNDVVLGPCAASNGQNSPASIGIDSIRLDLSSATASYAAASVLPSNVLDRADFEAGTGGIPPRDLYLASQYQVFFGPWDITEAFFTWRSPTSGNPAASETWFYNLREFWSQSRWWNDGSEKDPAMIWPTNSMITNREMLARMTVLDLDMASVQEFLKDTIIDDATADTLTGGMIPVPVNEGWSLWTRFNGLFYAARTNRYPWNPEFDGPNPWNPDLPNDTSSTVIPGGLPQSLDEHLALPQAAREAVAADLVDVMAVANQTRLDGGALGDLVTKERLQPYPALTAAPAFAPEQFFHAVRLNNAEEITWGFDAVGTPTFGTSKTMFVTPNVLFTRGHVNNVTRAAMKGTVTDPNTVTPLALAGDQITVLSANWNDDTWRLPGIAASAPPSIAVSGGSLARPWTTLPNAATTIVNAALITHNQPTTPDSVAMGEAASVIGLVLHNENWTGIDFDYQGSIVVMDTRRATGSYQLQTVKNYGPSPFGFMDASWRTVIGGLPQFNAAWDVNGVGRAWSGHIRQVYTAPNRIWRFNPDLLTPEGTPPFAPFGLSMSGVGGWMRGN